MKNLVIQHTEGSDPPKFQVIRPNPFLASDSVAVTPPNKFPVEGRPNSNLLQELQWYLEEFLDYPFHPATDHASQSRNQKPYQEHAWNETNYSKTNPTPKPVRTFINTSATKPP